MPVNAPEQIIHNDPANFVLPDFTRLAWVSESARAVWEPRVAAIRGAWNRIEWLSVVEDVRVCSLTRINPVDLPEHAAKLARYGLAVVPLGMEGQSRQSYSSTPSPYRQGQPFVYPVAIGRIKDTDEFVQAWTAGDHTAIGTLLGFPACCAAFFLRHWVDERRVDTTWSMAIATSTVVRKRTEHRIDIELSGCWSNVLCRWLGVRLVPHLPCAFDCDSTAILGRQLADVGRKHSFEREVEWMIEILSWPLEWSARHGIAEIRLPVVKIATRTDAYSETLTVRLLGKGEPEEMESGLRFPYRNKETLPLSDTKPFLRCLEERQTSVVSMPDESEFRDNGFSSLRAMEIAHAPIIGTARAALKGQEGPVLDLGCGNATLVEKICAGGGLIPCGVDVSAAVVARARERLCDDADRFIAADLFDVDAWPSFERYQAVILMVGRLLEAPPERVERLIVQLKERTDLVILYKYAGFHPDPIKKLVARFGLVAKGIEYTQVEGAVEVATVKKILRMHPAENTFLK